MTLAVTKLTTLSKETADEVLALVASAGFTRQFPYGRPDTTPQSILAPEVYLAKAPEGGIPGSNASTGTGTGTGDLFNFADCQLYRTYLGDDGNQKAQQVASFTRRVYNLFEADVPEGQWCLVVRDKFGTWWVIATAEEQTDPDPDPDNPTEPDFPGGGACDLVRIKPDDCVVAAGPINQVVLRPGGATWISDHCLKYFDKCGVVEFWFADGTPHLSVDGLELMWCGNNCFTGGPLTGHFRSGTDTTPHCQGEIFTVCIGCICCPSSSVWDGPGYYCAAPATNTGTGTSELVCTAVYIANVKDACEDDIILCSGPYDTLEDAQAVCPDDNPMDVVVPCFPTALRRTLTAIITGKTGDCTCIPDSLALVWDSVLMIWQSDPVPGYPCVEGNCSLNLECVGTSSNGWTLGPAECAGIVTVLVNTASELQFQVTNPMPGPFSNCFGSYIVTISLL